MPVFGLGRAGRAVPGGGSLSGWRGWLGSRKIIRKSSLGGRRSLVLQDVHDLRGPQKLVLQD